MKYERFEDLPVRRTAMELVLKVYRLTRDRFFDQPGDLRDLLRRARPQDHPNASGET